MEFAAYDEAAADDILQNGLNEEFLEVTQIAPEIVFGSSPTEQMSIEEHDEHIKEFGDMLWYCNALSVHHLSKNLGEIAVLAISRNLVSYTGDPLPEITPDITPGLFDGLAAQSTEVQPYRVINHKALNLNEYMTTELEKKLQPVNADLEELQNLRKAKEFLEEDGAISTHFYGSFMRSWSHITRALERQSGVTADGPFGNADFDDPKKLDEAIADMLWVTSISTQFLFNTSLENTLVKNLAKLERRKANGTLLNGADQDRS